MKIIRDFERKVRQFTETIPSGKIIVGLSGGADSVALLASLVAAGEKCIAAHCNFALRGEESERDMRHAVETAKMLGVECMTIKFNVPDYMKLHKCSLETACRELRYEWFEKLRVENNALWI
nr:7-cyano-7-deazaguanine synthase [Paramuribaculum sp.]